MFTLRMWLRRVTGRGRGGSRASKGDAALTKQISKSLHFSSYPPSDSSSATDASTWLMTVGAPSIPGSAASSITTYNSSYEPDTTKTAVPRYCSSEDSTTRPSPAVLEKADEEENALRAIEVMLEKLAIEDVQDNSGIIDSFSLSLSGDDLPPISLPKYCFRLVRYINRLHRETSNSTESSGFRYFILGSLYVQRLQIRKPEFRLTTMNAHRTLASAVFLAEKFHEDFTIPLSTVATIAGITEEDMVQYESLLCGALDFSLVISESLFEETRCMLGLSH